jgi:hypothetical protein
VEEQSEEGMVEREQQQEEEREEETKIRGLTTGEQSP